MNEKNGKIKAFILSAQEGLGMLLLIYEKVQYLYIKLFMEIVSDQSRVVHAKEETIELLYSNDNLSFGTSAFQVMKCLSGICKREYLINHRLNVTGFNIIF